jgi:ATP-dependent helicase/nuclease subunit A
MSSTLLPDQQARTQIHTDFQKNLFVEAGAGSGKTHSLVNRMLGLIQYGYADPTKIVAVTFTRKAAAELRERFQLGLEEIARNETIEEQRRERVKSALSQIEDIFVGTIHSFCAKMLRERPVEAEVDPGFEELEEEEDLLYAEEVWPLFLEEKAFSDPASFEFLQNNGVNPSDLSDFYRVLNNYPDIEIVRSEVSKPDFTQTRKEIITFLQDFEKKAIPLLTKDYYKEKLYKWVRPGIELASHESFNDDTFFVETLKRLSKEVATSSTYWQNKNDAIKWEEKALFLQSQHITPALTAWREYLYAPLATFALEGVVFYSQWRKDRSLLNFQDLLLKTAKMLKDKPVVREWFQKKITHILVDEFQDTDPIQAEILFLLTSPNIRENRWWKLSPRPGSLFMVGDPKQSIYRFRRADIDVYSLTKSRILSEGGALVTLTSNFRSTPSLNNLVNSLFENIFLSDSSYQPSYLPLEAIREESNTQLSGLFENIISKVYRNNASQIAATDARQIASFIAKRIQEKEAQAGDFLIITKKKAHLSLYAQQLEQLNIPYEITGGGGMKDSQELRQIFILLRAVADPQNAAAIVAALRGSFFGIRDDHLYQFVQSGGNFLYPKEIENAPAPVLGALEKLAFYQNIARTKEALAAIQTILEDIGAIPLALSQEMAATRSGNIFKALDLLRNYRIRTSAGFIELVDYLQKLLSSDSEEMSIFPPSERTVRIMNLHKAKGLEANIVILADPLGSVTIKPSLHVVRKAEEAKGYFLIQKVLPTKRIEIIAQPPCWEEISQEAEEYEFAESQRLNYVAFTRARNCVIISTYHESSKENSWAVFMSPDVLKNQLPLLTSIPSLQKESVSFSPDNLQTKKEEIEARVVQARKKSYDITSVTGELDLQKSFTLTSEKGDAWGRVVHKSLEACGKGNRSILESLAKQWLQEETLPSEKSIDLLHAVDRVLSSDLWKRMRAAEEKHFELPFAFYESPQKVIFGVIDLIFKEKDGWVIVDYKSDDFENDPPRKSHYLQQIGRYAEIWKKMTGEEVKETLLVQVS